jgi:hypothetical protein
VLLLRGGRFVAAAMAVRLLALVRGRRPTQTVPIVTGRQAVPARA